MSSSVTDGRGGEKQGERIAHIAARYGVAVATLRLYEQQGILPSARRTSGGHRRYDRVDLDWVDTVMLLRATGMSTAQMIQVSGLVRGDRRDEADALIAVHAEEVLQQAAQLRSNARALLRRGPETSLPGTAET
ncbi:MerR family transcriptional regulator [Microbacterium sp.]|uniref:MerR family transcriptional regulator n=1 Tax=Microbacterium sp. TaxID=51671 RepID=UPI003F995025